MRIAFPTFATLMFPKVEISDDTYGCILEMVSIVEANALTNLCQSRQSFLTVSNFN